VGAPGSGFAGLSAGERDRARAAGAHRLSTVGVESEAEPDSFLIAAAAFALLGEAARQDYLDSYAGRRFAEWTATCAPTRPSCRRWPSCCQVDLIDTGHFAWEDGGDRMG
jgi:hypothetical protein